MKTFLSEKHFEILKLFFLKHAHREWFFYKIMIPKEKKGIISK